MRRYAKAIFDALDLIATFPGMGRRRDELAPGLMSHPVEQHLIIYRATDDDLIVERFIHGSRDIAAEFGS